MGLTERECWFWLSSCEWMGIKSAERLLGYFKSARNIYYGTDSNYEKIKGLKPKLIAHLKARDQSEEYIQRAMERFEAQGGKFLCRLDREYPEKFRVLPDPPLGIFFYGTMPAPNQPMIAIVGAREASGYSLEAAGYFSRKLSEQGVGIISGLARGIDGEAHKSALYADGYTCGILGCGINICYPKENYYLFEQMKSRGGILSEYGMGVRPEAWHFPMRNRLISGLADGVFVIEARERSGSLITVDTGLEQGKNIYALPGHFHASLSKGCHQLIQCGAKLVYEPKDILEDFGIFSKENASKEKKLPLDKSEQLVYSSLSLGPKDIDTISMTCGLPLSDTISLLMKMELDGKIRTLGQNQYMLKL